ncbi:hypothetical protein AMTRI_Chr11g97620 [Amborella trichopoda]
MAAMAFMVVLMAFAIVHAPTLCPVSNVLALVPSLAVGSLIAFDYAFFFY